MLDIVRDHAPNLRRFKLQYHYGASYAFAAGVYITSGGRETPLNGSVKVSLVQHFKLGSSSLTNICP